MNNTLMNSPQFAVTLKGWSFVAGIPVITLLVLRNLAKLWNHCNISRTLKGWMLYWKSSTLTRWRSDSVAWNVFAMLCSVGILIGYKTLDLEESCGQVMNKLNLLIFGLTLDKDDISIANDYKVVKYETTSLEAVVLCPFLKLAAFLWTFYSYNLPTYICKHVRNNISVLEGKRILSESLKFLMWTTTRYFLGNRKCNLECSINNYHILKFIICVHALGCRCFHVVHPCVLVP